MHTHPHEGMTEQQVVYVLENWQLRGVRTDRYGRRSVVYLAVVPWRRKMVRVAVSMNDDVIITAFADTTATTNWNRGNIDHFIEYYADLEVRDDSYL